MNYDIRIFACVFVLKIYVCSINKAKSKTEDGLKGVRREAARVNVDVCKAKA